MVKGLMGLVQVPELYDVIKPFKSEGVNKLDPSLGKTKHGVECLVIGAEFVVTQIHPEKSYTYVTAVELTPDGRDLLANGRVIRYYAAPKMFISQKDNSETSIYPSIERTLVVGRMEVSFRRLNA